MRSRLLAPVALAVSLLVVLRTASAHHGWFDFDQKIEVSFQGTVTAFYFVNPHCVVEFDAKDEKGRVQKWQGEFSSKAELLPKGWSGATLEPGDKLTFTGHPSKDHSLAIHVTKIRAAGGELKLDLPE